MFGWIARLIGSASGPAPPRAEATAAPTGNAGADVVSAHFGLRRPLVGRSGRVGGFELCLPPALEQRLATRDDSSARAAQAAHSAALLASAVALQQSGRQALVVLPAAALASAGVAGQAGAGVMLLPVGAPAGAPAAADSALRKRGVLIGAADGPPERAPATDFVLLRAASGGIDTLLLSAQRWQEARPRLPLVALGLESIDDVERALASGIAWAGGRFDGKTGTAPARPLQAAAHRICMLLNELALDRDTAAVAEAVRADVALSYRLLRYANSPAIGLTRGVETVEQAVMLLGRAELRRWLAVMLMSAAAGRQASAALQEDALARGRLLEALARRQGVAQPEVLFTVGLLSRLPQLLQLPLAAALEPLRLSAEVRLALMQGQGPWADHLALADELERDDEARMSLLCARFGGIDAVLAEAECAWNWAARMVLAAGAG